MVSLAESFYGSREMPEPRKSTSTTLTLPDDPAEFREWVQENAPHLAPALAEASTGDGGSDDDADDKAKGKRKRVRNDSADGESGAMTEADVRRILAESTAGTPTVEEFETNLRERFTETLEEREHQRRLAERAHELIESAEGILPKWKKDLKVRYSMQPGGPPSTLLVEGEETDKDGNELTDVQVVEARVRADLDHCRELIAEAQGKPRVTGEGGARRDQADDRSGTKRAQGAFWRGRFVEMGLAESEDKAVEAFGGKVAG